MADDYLDYTAEAVEAARSVLIELNNILGEYRDATVLVGGWIPGLLLPAADERHVGSIDVDLALNHKQLTEAGYRMMGISCVSMVTRRTLDNLSSSGLC